MSAFIPQVARFHLLADGTGVDFFTSWYIFIIRILALSAQIRISRTLFLISPRRVQHRFASFALKYRRVSALHCDRGRDENVEEQTMADQDARITHLEETVAHQAKVIEELSDQFTEQWKVMEQTRAKLDRLTERFLNLEEQSLEAPAITRPPHY
jgi:SlyX protein